MRTYVFVTRWESTGLYAEAWQRTGDHWTMVSAIEHGQYASDADFAPIDADQFESYVQLFDTVDWNVDTLDTAGLIPAED